MRAMPWRFCGSMTGEICQTSPAIGSGRADRSDLRARADRHRGEIVFVDMRASISISPPLAMRNSTPDAGADHLAGLDLAGQHQAGGGRDGC